MSTSPSIQSQLTPLSPEHTISSVQNSTRFFDMILSTFETPAFHTFAIIRSSTARLSSLAQGWSELGEESIEVCAMSRRSVPEMQVTKRRLLSEGEAGRDV